MLFPSGSIPAGPAIEPQKALLLIDFQEEFVDQDNGKLPVPNVGDFVGKLPSLIAKFRSKGSVVFVRTEFREPRSALYPELACHNILLQDTLIRGIRSEDGEVRRHQRGRSSGTLKPTDPEAFLQAGPEDRRACRANTPGVEFCEVIAPAFDPERDLSVVKSHYSAFTETSLLLQLRTRMIQHVYVAGSLSNISVYATVLDAVRHGIEVTLIEDCLGYRNALCHEEAVRQMADVMGAVGTDHQELMDDLAGLLGDVIHEEDFSTRFHVSIGPPAVKRNSPAPPREPVSPEQRKQRVEDWISDNGPGDGVTVEKPLEAYGGSSKLEVDPLVESDSRSHPRSPVINSRLGTPEFSPPRKRSTQELDDIDDETRQSKYVHKPSLRRTPSDTRSDSRYKVNRTRIRGSRPSRESSNRPVTPSSLKALGIPGTPGEPRGSPPLSSDADTGSRSLTSPSAPKTMDDAIPSTLDKTAPHKALRSEAPKLSGNPPARKRKAKNSMSLVGPAEIIGEGDCLLSAPVISHVAADAAFYTLKRTVQWQKMYHRTGEVPRLVAVQGENQDDGESEPIYRHPADESPEMLPFDDTVNMLRFACEKRVGHPLNHALIQYYRNGEDNISEHSDKTLDIVRGSSIVNVSLGAQRILTIRTKKDTALRADTDGEEQPRITQRIPLMHNSIFILGQSTNQYWLHSVRADKRPESQKALEELAYGGERISLTFRQIGTFVNKRAKTIWGQGATSKSQAQANPLLVGEAAEREGENMIRAFGQENHQSTGWDWDKWYRQGFDVINFETKAT
ncbi:uncharacterized protein HMPREF1541_07663 [Cyphellophora europaea CBS 101466]|uniref:Fe2OG dioxygenase domain-containing protein n=1 Tax=Cyphellophora europaea (strain CBS 101466) TaxID=1220924 RepID=W2RNY8_CYPE1|nr:uncharacterized protein HMPREF1541_07663 [Cyphellophora europaea CBS 101466]ETN38040.1 hypothetical protein HMPREF1541_07663 [Cyphellophora europaea CBS 101466]